MIEHHKARPSPAKPEGILAFLWWAFFGNADDGYYGDEEWRAGRKPSFWLALQWWLRNPAHNFCFYVIGFADEDRIFVGDKNWGVDRGWSVHWLVTTVTGQRRPLLTYCAEDGTTSYIGWRPSGAFGVALRK